MIRPATQQDIDYVRANSVEDTKDYPRVELTGDVVALTNNGVLYAVGGVLVIRPGLGEFWVMLTKDFKECISSRAAVIEISDQVNAHSALHSLIRCQAVVRADFNAAVHMMEWLGFECEGLLRMYLPGDVDAYMYSRIEV